MKLKDILPYCLTTKNGGFENKYYWIIDGEVYNISSFESYAPEDSYATDLPYHKLFDREAYDFVTLNKRFPTPNDRSLVLNLNNEITVFDKFIMVHKTVHGTTETEASLFTTHHYFVAKNHNCSSQYYNIGLLHSDPVMGSMATNLRSVFKDLVARPVPSKPKELSLDDKVDDLITEVMKDTKTLAITKIKKMLNERL